MRARGAGRPDLARRLWQGRGGGDDDSQVRPRTRRRRPGRPLCAIADAPCQPPGGDLVPAVTASATITEARVDSSRGSRPSGSSRPASTPGCPGGCSATRSQSASPYLPRLGDPEMVDATDAGSPRELCGDLPLATSLKTIGCLFQRNLGGQVDVVMTGHPADLAPESTARAYDRSSSWGIRPLWEVPSFTCGDSP